RAFERDCVGIIVAANGDKLIEVDDIRKRFFVVDAQKNRVIVIDETGRVIETIGNGATGNKAGRFPACQFNAISGLAYDSDQDVLYISDSNNHQVKKADFETGEVKVVLGSGKPSLIAGQKVTGVTGSIDFPGSLVFQDNLLFIAMNGDRQLYKFNTLTAEASLIAGSGNRKVKLGKGKDASFESMNQLFKLGDFIGVLDVLNQQVFSVSKEGEVQHQDFIEMAKKDYPNAYISSVLMHESVMYLSDAMTGKILKIEEEEVKIFSGKGSETYGYNDGKSKKAKYRMISDLKIFGKELLAVDQGNGQIRRISLKKGKSTSLDLTDYKFIFMNFDPYGGESYAYTDVVPFSITERGVLTVDIQLPEGYSWDRSGRNEVYITEERGSVLTISDPTTGYIEVDVQPNAEFPNLSLQVFMTAKGPEDQVLFQAVVLSIPFDLKSGGPTEGGVVLTPFTVQ
ncbi:MAG: hypothetical protein AAF193_04930, partial [Bacteroidota bacterium]